MARGTCELLSQDMSLLHSEPSMAPTSPRAKAQIFPTAHKALLHLPVLSLLSPPPVPPCSLYSCYTCLLTFPQTHQQYIPPAVPLPLAPPHTLTFYGSFFDLLQVFTQMLFKNAAARLVWLSG